MSYNILWGCVAWCGFLCVLACAYRGAWRGWAEFSMTRATVTDAPAPAPGWQSAAVDKALFFSYLLPDDCVS